MSRRRGSRRQRRPGGVEYAILGFGGLVVLGSATSINLAGYGFTLMSIIIPIAGVITIALVAAGLFLQRQHVERLQAVDIAHIDRMTGEEFEVYLAKLLPRVGFNKVSKTKTSGDFGADLIATKDRKKYSIQVKCYGRGKTVGNDALYQALGGKAHYHCTNSMVITNRAFTAPAKVLAVTSGTILVDREELGKWLLMLKSDK